VLFNSKDVPAASLAASRLAELALREDDIPKAAEYYTKILRSAPEFFLEKIDRSKRLMDIMAEQKLYVPAALLAEVLIERVDAVTSEYEALLLNLARWQNLSGMGEKALISYERYLAEYPFSAQSPIAQKERDLLEFSIGRSTPEANLALYDEIATKYPEDEAANRALFEKLKTLMKLGRYVEASKLLPKLDALDKKLFHDFDLQMRQTERVLLDSFLEAGDCKSAVSLSKARNLGVLARRDEIFFDCARAERDFGLALEIADSNARKLSPAEGAEWYARRLDTLYFSADYANDIDGEERYLKMLRALNRTIDADRFLRLFDAYRRTGFDVKRERELAETFEARFPKDPRLMDIYAAMISLSQDQNDTKSQYDYAKKLVNRSRMSAIEAFTPDAEIAFAEAAVKEGKPDEAILVLRTTLEGKLDDRVRTRALFMLGDILERNENVELARAAFESCANFGDDPWANLCKEKTAL
jgi:hypothetical protein